MSRHGFKNVYLDDIERFLIHSICHDLGIVVMEHYNLDINKQLNTLPPEKARLAKRRFRKLWRNEYKKEIELFNGMQVDIERTKRKYGVGEKNPTRLQRSQRKYIVLEAILASAKKVKHEIVTT